MYPSGKGPAYSGPIRWGLYSRPIVLTQEGRSLVNDVWMCAWLKGEVGWVGMSSLSGIYSAPLLGVAYCLA